MIERRVRVMGGADRARAEWPRQRRARAHELGSRTGMAIAGSAALVLVAAMTVGLLEIFGQELVDSWVSLLAPFLLYGR